MATASAAKGSRKPAKKPPAAKRRSRTLPRPAPTAGGRPNILAWAQQFLPHYFTDPPCAFQEELFRDAADDSLRLLARIAPRGHAKSTCLALAYPLWCVCEQRRRNIVLVTHETTLATQFVRDLRLELESNDLLRERYGNLVN